MNKDNPYKVVAKKHRKRFKAEVVGRNSVELIDRKTGEVKLATQIVGNSRYYDTTDFVKLFEPAILIKMSRAEVAVFCYLISHLQFGGYAVFDYNECLVYTGYNSRQTIYRGLVELNKKDVIRQKAKGEWWVNPNIVYRGQRDEFEVVNPQ